MIADDTAIDGTADPDSDSLYRRITDRCNRCLLWGIRMRFNARFVVRHHRDGAEKKPVSTALKMPPGFRATPNASNRRGLEHRHSATLVAPLP